MTVSSPPATRPTATRPIHNTPLHIYLGCYGLVAEQIHDGILFTTMRRYSGKVCTTLSRVIKQEPGMTVSEPIKDIIKMSECYGPLTQKKMAELHKLNFQMFILEIEFTNLPH